MALPEKLDCNWISSPSIGWDSSAISRKKSLLTVADLKIPVGCIKLAGYLYLQVESLFKERSKGNRNGQVVFSEGLTGFWEKL